MEGNLIPAPTLQFRKSLERMSLLRGKFTASDSLVLVGLWLIVHGLSVKPTSYHVVSRLGDWVWCDYITTNKPVQREHWSLQDAWRLTTAETLARAKERSESGKILDPFLNPENGMPFALINVNDP